MNQGSPGLKRDMDTAGNKTASDLTAAPHRHSSSVSVWYASCRSMAFTGSVGIHSSSHGIYLTSSLALQLPKKPRQLRLLHCCLDTSGIKRATATLRVHQPQARLRRVVAQAWRGLALLEETHSSLQCHPSSRRNFRTRMQAVWTHCQVRVAMFFVFSAFLCF